MKALKEFTIPFVGLKIGQHQFTFQLDKKFFEHFEYEEFNDASVQMDVLLDKKSTFLEFTLTFNGTVAINCDITNEPYNQDIAGTYHFVVKFGDSFNDEELELLTLPHGSYEVNIAQYMYETIVLSVPARRVHPGILDGSLKSDILDKLEELRPKVPEVDGNLQEGNKTDPRWDTLKKLLTDK